MAEIELRGFLLDSFEIHDPLHVADMHHVINSTTNLYVLEFFAWTGIHLYCYLSVPYC